MIMDVRIYVLVEPNLIFYQHFLSDSYTIQRTSHRAKVHGAGYDPFEVNFVFNLIIIHLFLLAVNIFSCNLFLTDLSCISLQ